MNHGTGTGRFRCVGEAGDAPDRCDHLFGRDPDEEFSMPRRARVFGTRPAAGFIRSSFAGYVYVPDVDAEP